MPREPIPFPIGGLSENVALSDQPAGTSSLMRNVRSRDPLAGRVRGAQRGGTSRFFANPIGAGPVRRIQQVSFDAPNQTYADLGNSLVIEDREALPGKDLSQGVVIGHQSDRYLIDASNGIAKLNSTATLLWKIALPTEDKDHRVRALAVDGNTDIVYAGVSAGGKQETARIWAYVQEDDNQTELLWQVEPKGYCEQLRIYNNTLYALLNFPDKGQAWVYVYTQITAGQDSQGSGGPFLSKSWEVMYPANDFDISMKDGSVFVASDANTQRGFNPAVPNSTTQSVNWTPRDLTNSKERIWSWHDATDRDSLDISPLSPTAGDEGGEVVTWRSKKGFGDGRDWYANHQLTTFLNVPPGESGPVYRTAGIGGLPSISFSGAIYNGSHPGDIAGQTMAGSEPSTSDRGFRLEQKTPLPTYKGAQFCLVMVCKGALDDVLRGLIGITTNSDPALTRALSFNIGANTLFPIPGSIRVRDAGAVASTNLKSTPNADGPSGPGGTVNPGATGSSGLTIITWIMDGGVHDRDDGFATRSLLRVNGQPADRWQCSPYFATLPIMLGLAYLGSSGFSRFAGMIGEMICLSDWQNQDGDKQTLVSCPGYPDAAWGANSDTEVERLEGYLANRWGCADQLVTGQGNFLNFTGTPAVGASATIDSTTYTFRNVLAAANDVAIGGGQRAAMNNLFQAINRIGNPGTDYHAETRRHPTFEATAGVEAGASDLVVGIRSRTPYQGPVACTSSGALAWYSSATFITRAGGGAYGGYYPHPFTLQKTTNSMGGPPANATNTAATVTPYLLLNSAHPALQKYEAATGNLKWVATSGSDITASTVTISAGPPITQQYRTSTSGIGGVGFAVKVNGRGQIFSLGPKQAAIGVPPALATPETVTADPTDIRKFGDTGAAFTITPAAEGDPWTATLMAAPDVLQSPTARMDVDAFDNLYAPVFYTGSDVNYQFVVLVAYRNTSLAGVGVQFIKYTNASVPHPYAVAVDPDKPSFPTGDTIQHGEFVYLATQATADSNHYASWKLRELSTTNTSGSVRGTQILAVCAGQVFHVERSTSSTLVTGPTLDTATSFIDSCYLQGKAYFVDGKKTYVYDPATTTIAELVSKSSGRIPLRCKLIASWNSRLVLARPADNAQQWFMSKQGDPENWDQAPPTITEAQSVAGADSRTNLPSGPINALVSLRDDLLLFGLDGSIARMTGDPMAGGMFHPISQETGMAFGASWCRDPDGYWYFFGDSGGVFRGDGNGQEIVRISLNKIEDRLSRVDLSLYRIEMAWSYQEDGLKVSQVPIGAGGVPVDGWFWERQTESWSVETYGTAQDTTRQITCLHAVNGDLPDDRLLLYGCEDGRIRFHDRTARDDDGAPVDSFALIGPFAPGGAEEEMLFTDFELVTAREQDGPNWFLYVGETADVPIAPAYHGRVISGRAPRNLARVRGSFVWYGLGLAEIGGRWAFESLACRADPMGIKRSSVLA